MSSNHEYLERADVKMLERVLERAGYYASLVDTSDTQYAAQFVLRSCPTEWCNSAVAQPLASAPSIAL